MEGILNSQRIEKVYHEVALEGVFFQLKIATFFCEV